MLVTILYCKEKLLIDHFWECNQFWEFGIGSANNHLFDILLYSHYFYAWYCIDIVRRKFSLDHSWELTYCWGKMMCWSIICNIHIHLHSLTCSPEKNSFKKECNQKCWKKWEAVSSGVFQSCNNYRYETWIWCFPLLQKFHGRFHWLWYNLKLWLMIKWLILSEVFGAGNSLGLSFISILFAFLLFSFI